MNTLNTLVSILVFAVGLGLIAFALQWIPQTIKQVKAERAIVPQEGQNVRIAGHGDELFVVVGPESSDWYRVRKVDGPREPFPVHKDSIFAPKSNL